jgi:hypothetical protein
VRRREKEQGVIDFGRLGTWRRHHAGERQPHGAAVEQSFRLLTTSACRGRM